MSVPIIVPATVQERLGIHLLAFLGGRFNKHWLVEAGQERLVLRRWAQPELSIRYECRLVKALAARGWPVAPALADPIDIENQFWSLAPFLPGDPPPSSDDPRQEQRSRGQLLATLHQDLALLSDFGQRAGWRRCEVVLADSTLDQTLSASEAHYPQDVRIVRWHLDRARERIASIATADLPGIVVHGDFTTWNLRFIGKQLTGILDFELAHRDHRVSDFALSWRGKYDEVIHSYNAVWPLAPEEWALITPMWWAFLIEQACHALGTGTPDDGWTIRKLLERSPIMGPDASPFL